MSRNTPDPDALRAFSFNLWSYKMGEVVSLMVHLGDRLGLYEALSGIGPVTAAELAERTGLYERWLLERLRQKEREKRLLRRVTNRTTKVGERDW